MNLDYDDLEYEPYIPVAQRMEAKLAKLTSLSANSEKDQVRKQRDELEERTHEEEDDEAQQREKARKERTLLMEAQEVHSKRAEEGLYVLNINGFPLILSADARKTEGERAEEADAEILAAIASRRKLASDMELAKGISYTEPLKVS